MFAPAGESFHETYTLIVSADDYLLGNERAEAGVRLGALSRLFDVTTFAHFTRIGVAPGWKIWEVGAGTPEVARWLAERVGPEGRVIASDIDTSWLGADLENGFEVLVHDVVDDPTPHDSFDLIHARLVLVHLRERERVIAKLVDALSPGGWLLLEEADPALQPLVCLDEVGMEEEYANALKRAFRTLLEQRGADLRFGRTVPRLLRGAGLIDVQADAYFPIGGAANEELEIATVEHVRSLLVAEALASEMELESHLDAVRSHRLELTTSPLVSVWGRKPSRPDG